MKASHFFSKLLLSVLFLPTFISAESIHLENEAARNAVYRHPESMFDCTKDNHCDAVFASYRNDRDITIPAGDTVLFNVKNANKGDGICYNEDGTFTVKKSGFYLINYGLASIGTAGTAGAAFGFNLIKIRDCHYSIVDSVLTNSSSAIVLFLKEHDRVAVVSQEFLVRLIAGNLPPRTTSLTDTAHISFVKLDHSCK